MKKNLQEHLTYFYRRRLIQAAIYHSCNRIKQWVTHVSGSGRKAWTVLLNIRIRRHEWVSIVFIQLETSKETVYGRLIEFTLGLPENMWRMRKWGTHSDHVRLKQGTNSLFLSLSHKTLDSTCHRPFKYYRAKFLMEKALGVRANQVMIKHMDAALETVSV